MLKPRGFWHPLFPGSSTTRNMPKNRIYKCSTCGRSHAKPTGRRCQWVDLEQLEEPNDSTDSSEHEQSTNELANALRGLTAQMASFGERMAAVETARDNGVVADNVSLRPETEQAAAHTPPAQSPQDNLSIPSLQELRRDYEVGREVSRRLAEMDMADYPEEGSRGATGRARGKRSGAARTVQDTIVRIIDWPHFHIYAPPGTEPVTYDKLSIQQFAFGYMQMVDQPGAQFDKKVMWDLLKAVLEDAVEFSWPNVRNFFWIVGNQVENDRLAWSETVKIEKMRAKYSQKHELEVKPHKPDTQQTPQAPAERLRYCGPYQRGQCTERGDHAGLKHMCAHCFRVKSMPYPHPEAECRRKATEQSKNGRGGE